jgi:hypothetical protein
VAPQEIVYPLERLVVVPAGAIIAYVEAFVGMDIVKVERPIGNTAEAARVALRKRLLEIIFFPPLG